MNAITQHEIDQQVFSLYDEYCHGGIDRREFLKRASALGALTFALSLLPDYARAQTISFTDSRIKAQYVTYPSAGGNGDKMRGYLVQPARQGPFPAVLALGAGLGHERRAQVVDREDHRDGEGDETGGLEHRSIHGARMGPDTFRLRPWTPPPACAGMAVILRSSGRRVVRPRSRRRAPGRVPIRLPPRRAAR